MEDTIAAIATSNGIGAISIIRVSGKEAISIVNQVFKGKDLNKVSSHTINYGYIIDNDKILDEVLVSVMRAPKTFTMEDIVEINCHGGIVTTNSVLELLILKGCRLAEPGEFTKRAFLNGRIDLIEAEAVSDIITATNDQARNLAINQVRGNLTKLITECRNDILSIYANIEVNIDYPEYEDNLVVTHELVKEKVASIISKVSKIVDDSKNSQIIKNGIDIVLVGKPNVGKSSLLNTFLDEKKAIVTNIAGTTRDIVEGSVIYKDIQLNFIDTAGIHETDNEIEKIGVLKSREKIQSADLVVIVLNNNEELTNEDQEIIDFVQKNEKKYLFFINKNDLDKKIKLNDENIIYGNTLSSDGIRNLKEAIINMFNVGDIATKDLNYLSNVRQITLAKKSLEVLKNIEKNNNDLVPVDMLTIDFKEVLDLLGEIIGITYKDELLDELFSKFCLGK